MSRVLRLKSEWLSLSMVFLVYYVKLVEALKTYVA